MVRRPFDRLTTLVLCKKYIATMCFLQNIRKLKRQFDRFMKMSPMVRDFCGAEFYTDKFEIYRNSNNFVKLKEDEEYLKYVRRGYTALVCGFDAR
jgi:hypothetical protein